MASVASRACDPKQLVVISKQPRDFFLRRHPIVAGELAKLLDKLIGTRAVLAQEALGGELGGAFLDAVPVHQRNR